LGTGDWGDKVDKGDKGDKGDKVGDEKNCSLFSNDY
jgi:hypothetical protein